MLSTLRQTVIAFVLVTLGVVVGLALSGLPAFAQFPEEPARCAVPKAYGPFRAATLDHGYVFEDGQGTIRVVGCVYAGPGALTAEVKQMVRRD